MDDRPPLPFRGGRFPASFRCRVVSLPPGVARLYSRFEWRDAIVFVECGGVEVETTDGSRYRFPPGAVLSLYGPPVRSLRNPGPVGAVLVAVSRRATDSF